MAAKVKVKFDILDQISRLNSSQVKTEVASEVIKMIRDFTSKGISPIKGERRFVRYKNPDNYPAGKKTTTPVNLRLTGEMMSKLTYWFTNKSVFIGYRDKTNNDKAAGHHGGNHDLPERPFIPINGGSEFNITIMKMIREIYSRYLSDIIKKANR